jgi:ribosome-binding protein aMBF1 (putative translation factor)
VSQTNPLTHVERRFGADVRTARRAHGWTQADLADLCDGLDRKMVSDLEGGRRRWALWQASTVATVLGLRLSWTHLVLTEAPFRDLGVERISDEGAAIIRARWGTEGPPAT